MNSIRKYGKVQSKVNGFTSDGHLSIAGKTRSFVLLNQGLTNCTIDINGNSFILSFGDSITFGGYDDSLRYDDLNFIFAGGTGKVLVIQDILIAEPNYIEA